MTLADLRAALAHPNVAAFLRVVREGESSQRDDAYTVMFGGAHFVTPPWQHPYHGRTTTQVGHSTAAGAYQHLGTSWAELCALYGFTDFSPPNQDLGGVGGLVKRHALDDVLAGRIPEAIAKCRPEWTSLPGAAENSARYTMDKALAVYGQYGGKLATQPAAPIEEREIPTLTDVVTPAPQPPQAKPMLPFLIPILAELIPQIAKILIPAPGVGSEVAQRNAALANVVVDTVVKTTADLTKKEQTPATAVEAISSDPVLLKAVTQAVVTHPDVLEVLEVGGGVEKARAADLAVMASDKPFWKASAVFAISMAMLPIIYWLVGSLIVGGIGERLKAAGIELPAWGHIMLAMFGSGWTGEARSGGFNLVVGLILGGICGVYYGISVTQNKQQSATSTQQG